jgi:hypothetical protein
MSTPDPVPGTSPTAAGPPPLAPGRIGVTDVQRVEDANRAFRALDYQYGGGACHEPGHGTALRRRRRPAQSGRMDLVRHRPGPRCPHPLRSRPGAGQGGPQLCNYALVANILYRTGRVHLHHNVPDKALPEFQLGQVRPRLPAPPWQSPFSARTRRGPTRRWASMTRRSRCWAGVRTSSPEPTSPRPRPGPRSSPRPTCPPWSAPCTLS